MFWYQIWKKVHRPIIVLSVVAFIVVTASHSEIDFNSVENDEHRNNHRLEILSNSFSDNDLLLRKSSALGDSNSNKNNQGLLPSDDDLLDSMPKIPLPPVQQLPYCNNWNTGNNNNGQLKSSGDEAGSHQQQHHENYNASDGGEIVPIGRHVVVATLDGKVSLLDQSGHILWTISTGQVFSSTISSLQQLNENGKYIHLIPSLTGGLYKYDGDNLTPMPLNAESLLRKSFKLSNDVVMAGGKELRTFGVALSTGNLRYECGLDGCSTPTKAESHREDDIILVVKKQLQTVRAIDSSTGSERWNFSVATHELALAGVTEGCYEGEKRDASPDHLVKVIIPEGIIMGADKSNHAVWQHKFGSPISQAWILENGELRVIDPIKNSPLLDESPALYIGIHKSQFYVQESHSTAEKLENAFAIQVSKRETKPKPVEITWKPSSAIEGMNDNKALAKYEPFSGFYVFENEELINNLPAIEAPPRSRESESNESGEQNHFDNNGSDYFSEGAIQIIFVSLGYWWKEVIGISLLTAVILNLLFMRPIVRAVRAETIRQMLTFLRNIANKPEERALLPRRQSDTLELPPAYRTRTRTTSSSSNASQLGYVEQAGELQFNSQYLREFEPIQCLGKGGFGVVFEAKKKIDDRNYAVKRIPLPNREKNREKVMREVKALAKLDHRNIVRYFNAWIENPPPGWLEKNDPLYSVCNFENSSANYLSDTGLSQSIIPSRYANGYKRDYSEISMPSKTPVDETVDDDSFIVFQADSFNNNDDEEEDGDGDKSVNSNKKKLEKSFGGFKKNKRRNIKTRKDLKSKLTWDDDSDYDEDEEGDSECKKSPLLPVTINDSRYALLQSDNSGVSARRSTFFSRPTSLSIPSSYDDGDEKSISCQQQKQDLLLQDMEDEQVEEIGEDVAASIPTSIMYLYIQQELCQKKTLQFWLKTAKNRNLRQVVEFFSQIVEAVEYIHSHKLIHRDLKPGNIFLSNGSSVENISGGDSGELFTVKIGDFGLATTAISRLDKDTLTPATETPATDRQVANLTGHVGTHLYMSPEQSQNKPYDFKVDIYSLGLIFFELLVPFSTDMERYDVLSRVRKMNFPTLFKKNYKNEHSLILEMVAHDPETRPNATEVKTWVKQRLLNLSSLDESSTPVACKLDSYGKSYSADANLYPTKKYVSRLSYDEEKLLNRTQSSPIAVSSPVGADKQYAPKLVKLVDEISKLTLIEVSELNELLKKTLNIPDTPMMMGGMMQGAVAAAPKEEEEVAAPARVQTEFTLKLVKYDEAKKVALIKEIKNLLEGMNLVQSKKFVESVPTIVKANIPKDEAEKLKAAFEAVGGSCEIS